jgi:hydrogenase maturation factor
LGAGVLLHIGLAIWAVVSRNNAKNDKKLKEMEKRIITSQIINEN